MSKMQIMAFMLLYSMLRALILLDGREAANKFAEECESYYCEILGVEQ